MLRKMRIYKAEADAGLQEKIAKNTSISYCVPVQPENVNKSNIKKFLAASSDSNEFDLEILYPTKSVLVTSSWNRNGDVFGVEQLWEARNTPLHQYTNINHDHNQIVGHITNTWVIDADGNTIDDDTTVDNLPSMIHICNGAVIYKHYKEEELVERANELIEQIEAGEKYVSMECLFPDFDYAVISPDNQNYIISRNEDTAFLTKHLRAYGGDGEFDGYKLGRYIKNMIFSGKGYVDKPANPESIIFTSDKPDFSFSDAKCQNKFIFKNGVNINSGASKMTTKKSCNSKENIMADTDFYKSELEAAKAQIAKLIEKNDELAKSFTEANVEKLKSEISDLTSQVAVLTTEKEEIFRVSSEASASIDVLTKSLSELTEEKAALEAAVEQAKAEKLFADRVAVFVDAGLEREEAESAVSKFITLNDEQFAEIASIYAKSLFGEMKREAEQSRDADPKMSETDEVLSNKGFAADKMMKDEEKGKDKKKYKKEGEASEDLDEVLDTAETDTTNADVVGSTEADDESEKVVKVRQSLASYFAGAFGQSEEKTEQ